LSREDENLAKTNTRLREAGHAVHCKRISKLSELEDAIGQYHPELVILFADEPDMDLAVVAGILAKFSRTPPLLVARREVTEHTIAEAMESGARDVVSLTHRNRFRAVVDRELQAHRMKVALDGVLSSASQYKQELRTLMKGAAEAIADVQEGIIVAANPAWLSLFGYEAEKELEGEPFMDLYRQADRPLLKGALVATLARPRPALAA
jgi:PAS domain-containing protein